MKQNRLRNVFGCHKLADVKRNGTCIRECDVWLLVFTIFVQCKNLLKNGVHWESSESDDNTFHHFIVVVFADRMIRWMSKVSSCERHYSYAAIWYCDCVRLRWNFNGNLPSGRVMRRCSRTYTMTCPTCRNCLHKRHTGKLCHAHFENQKYSI